MINMCYTNTVALVAGKEAPMKERHLKIYEAPGQKRNIPRINLQGEWLSNLGYQVGDHVVVSYEQGKLIVELEPKISTEAES